jgi:hypothetical protein
MGRRSRLEERGNEGHESLGSSDCLFFMQDATKKNRPGKNLAGWANSLIHEILLKTKVSAHLSRQAGRPQAFGTVFVNEVLN